MQNPDFAQGENIVYVEVLKDVKEQLVKDYRAYNIQLSNQIILYIKLVNSSDKFPVNGQKEVEAVYGIGEVVRWNPSIPTK